MSSWELLICPQPGRSSRRYRIGPVTLGIVAVGVLLILASAGWLGWQIGQSQAASLLGGGPR